MSGLKDDYEKYLKTVSNILETEGLADAVGLLRGASGRIEETGFDNWNGGTTVWTIYLSISASDYARLGTVKRETIERLVDKRLKAVAEQFDSGWVSVKIVPSVDEPVRANWKGDVSFETRQNIIDGLKLESVKWHGELDDVEFLERIFDVGALPSHDHRFENAARDIWQHRYNNDDWEPDWIYSDKRFNLLRCPPEIFLKFLSEMVHPVVRKDRDEALKLVQHFNDQLQRDGWRFVEQEKIAGRPRFVAQKLGEQPSRSVSRARTVADALDAGWMQKAIERLEHSIDSDPWLAIGTAKELVESCCKSILEKRGVTVSRTDDLPKLTKTLARELQLVPEGISDEAKGAKTVRLILQNLSVLTQYIAELRGLYGTGHGWAGDTRGLEPRHARLAAGAAVTFIDFVTETYHCRFLKRQDKSEVSEGQAELTQTKADK